MKSTKVIIFSALAVAAVTVSIFLAINYSNTPSITKLADALDTEEVSFLNQVIPDTDLPPPGTRSLFDHLMAQNDGLPYPYNGFIDLLKDLSPDNKEPLSILVPDGRSLLKGQANKYHPRIITAPDFQGENTPAGLGLATQGQLFLAFVEAADELEVISYNEAAGRFEFQLVKNYCEGCIPQIVYARRAICLTCHQGDTPIFSERPWNETNGQLAVSSMLKTSLKGMTDYFGVDIQQPLASPERIDELTDIGNFFVPSQRVWLEGCGENGNECRRALLSLALQYADQPGQFDPQSDQVKDLITLWSSTYPKNGIEVPQSDLKNRDPLGQSKSTIDWLYDTFTPDISFGDGAKTNDDLEAFEKLPPLSPAIDPLTSRLPKKVLQQNDIDGVYGISRFFTDADITSLNQHYNFSLDLLLKKVEELPNSVFAPKPFSRVVMMRHLLSKELQYCCLDTSDMSPPQVNGVPELAINEHIELKNYEEYCFACHRGNPAKRLDFMSGENEKIVLERIQAKSEIREALDWERYTGSDKASTLMPPTDSIQYKKLKQAGEQPRKEMRDTVPSMFGF